MSTKTTKNELRTILLNGNEYPFPSEITPRDGHTRRAGYLVLCVRAMLDWLHHNTNNRKPNWMHIFVLMTSMRGDDWVSDASSTILDWSREVADGQCRAIAFVLAYGTREEVEELLRLFAIPFNQCGDGSEVPNQYDPQRPLPVPVRKWTLCGQEVPTDLYVMVNDGADPRAREKADTDVAKRTGANELTMNRESASLLAELGIDEEIAGTAIRLIYLRCLPPTDAARESGSLYGTTRKGGNIPPDRYPVIMRLVKDCVTKANDLIASEAELGSDSHPCHSAIPFPQLLAFTALAVQGGVDRKQLVKVLRAWTAERHEHHSPASLVCWSSINKQVSPPLNPNERLYAFIYELAHGIQKDWTTCAKIRKILGDNPEQEPDNRLPGWDTDGNKDFLSDSLRRKLLTAARKKAKAMEAVRAFPFS